MLEKICQLSILSTFIFRQVCILNLKLILYANFTTFFWTKNESFANKWKLCYGKIVEKKNLSTQYSVNFYSVNFYFVNSVSVNFYFVNSVSVNFYDVNFYSVNSVSVNSVLSTMFCQL